jgi:hypothetical protein
MAKTIEYPEEEVSSMFFEGKKNLTSEEQLAMFMHRFNLDIDTVMEKMPAFQEHCKKLFPREDDK